MHFLKSFSTILLGLAVLVLISCLTQFAKASEPLAKAKTYAVFVASFNSKTGQAVGGVAGTAFFTSAQTAVTAYHVLQSKSFQPLAGFEHAQVWLVHEGEGAIELSASDISTHADQDLTSIQLSGSRRAKLKYVFAVATAAATAGSQVATEGFVASSTGPILRAEGSRLVIGSVPKLSRLEANGQLLLKTAVDIASVDVNLRGASCMQLSYQPVVGLSGGPVLSDDGKVIGMNSFADPNGRTKTWAVQMGSI